MSLIHLPTQDFDCSVVAPSSDPDIADETTQVVDAFFSMVRVMGSNDDDLRTVLRSLYSLGHAHGTLDTIKKTAR